MARECSAQQLRRVSQDRARSCRGYRLLCRDSSRQANLLRRYRGGGTQPVYERLRKGVVGQGPVAAWDATIAAARGSNAP
jgi:hypothetical protein